MSNTITYSPDIIPMYYNNDIPIHINNFLEDDYCLRGFDIYNYNKKYIVMNQKTADKLLFAIKIKERKEKLLNISNLK